MEFGKHIGKGLWAFADKALPAIYGLGFVFLVVRFLPQKEFGAYALIQTIFGVVGAAGTAFALQPLIKFAAETEERGPYIVASLVMQFLLFLFVSVVVLVFRGPLANLFDPGHQVNLLPLFGYLPLLFAASYYRNFAVGLLQASYRVQRIFWIDAVYFMGVLLVVYLARTVGMFQTAADMLSINVMTLACSTLLAIILTWREMSVGLVPRSEAFAKMWHFGKYTFGGSSIYIVFSQLDVFFVTSFAGIVAVAMYQAAKVMTRLNDVLAQVLQMFLIPFSSKGFAREDTEKLTVAAEKAICFSTLLFLPVFLAMFFFPEVILHLLYKGKYDDATAVVRVLSFLALTVPWNGVVTSYMVGMGMVRQGLYASIALLGIALPAYALLTPAWGPVGTSIGLVGSFFVITVALVIYLRRFIPINLLNVLKRTEDAWTFARTRFSSPPK
ncbi:MAG: oligosaccharide flippase family protein [Bacteroidota bacterium]|jgi:O-antigen/teichoic acid export membrane protein